ncbi:PPK2 family polyphosphate kinase [Litorimonas sp.]|uniref:PPK2 family polyphosphate kinase n=1 Tax=Litorimonas sp. TaxID=1892381 RepID=UPI003A8A16B5
MADINTNDFIVTDNNIRLSDRPTHVGLFDDKDDAEDEIKDNAKEIADLAHKLYAEAGRSVIIVLQGMDTSGKDGTTEALFHRTPPLNVNVANFKAPTKKELAHDYLWRVHKVCPAVGQITVFNRSHYEDVLVVKVKNYVSADKIEQRYDQINDFERLLVENDTTVLKFMLHISHETQGERLRERLVETHKLWKFNPGDLEDRALWPEFMDAYQTMLRRTSTHHAPWYVIPSDSRKTRGAIVSSIVRQSLERMNPQYPDPGFNPEDFEI